MLVQFALRLIAGMSLMWMLLPRRQISSGFFRIQMLVTLGLAVLASLAVEPLPGTSADTALLSPGAATGLCVAAAAASFLGSVLWTLERRAGATGCAGVVLVLATAALLGLSETSGGVRTTTGTLHLASEMSSAALLGGAVVGMLLGHWYLTAPTMSHAPLWRATACFGAAAVARLAVSAVALWIADVSIDNPTQTTWLALRWLAGIAGPIVVSVMIWRILKYRNTQSATGVLFVGVILTFIGETTAMLLYRELPIPL